MSFCFSGSMYLPLESTVSMGVLGSPIAEMNWSKRKDVSEGPDLASGWNCAVNHLSSAGDAAEG